jgi:hypothetical protein
MAPLKRYFGPALFVVATLTTWAKGYDRRQPAFSVRAGDATVDDGYLSVFLNTDPYTFLGNRPLHIAPGTSMDGDLSLVTLETLALRTMLPVLASALGSGDKLARHRHVSLVRDLKNATVKGYRPVPYQLDGDFVGESDQIELSWTAEALSVVVPVVPSGTLPTDAQEAGGAPS